jgi:hypothetical protein
MRLIRLILILAFVLTGQALAAARGQAQLGERVVLCSGHAVVIVYGADGAPVESPYFCPDMALAIMAAVDAAMPEWQRVLLLRPAFFASPDRSVDTSTAIAAQARDPPLVGLA